jgi:hypothetical protein
MGDQNPFGAPGEPQGGDAGDNGDDASSQGDAADWEEVLEQLPDTAKASYEAHINGLKNTVSATREDNRKLRDEVKAAAAGAEGPLKDQLNALSERLQEREREVSFLDEAIGQKCRKPRALWVLAKADEAFDRYGRPDWNHLRSSYSELFDGSAPAPRGNAGAGTGGVPDAGPSMEDLLRKAARG